MQAASQRSALRAGGAPGDLPVISGAWDLTDTLRGGAAPGKPRALIFIERYLPPSEAFILAQARAYGRYAPGFLVSARDAGVHDDGGMPVEEASRTPLGKAGLLMLKIPRIGMPGLFRSVQGAGLIHAHFGKNGYVAGPLARAARVPLVTTFHGFDATYQGAPKDAGGFNQVRFFREGRAQMGRWNSWNVAVSDFIKARLLELGFREDRILRHYIGIDPSLFTPAAAPRRKGRVVSVARFVSYKGHRFMIDALERVAKSGVDIEFVMVGEGPLRAEIEAEARRRLPSVAVHPRLSQPEIRDLLGTAELYLHGSVTLDNGHAEAFGIANLEAQAVGTPVVAFRSGGVGEAVEHGATGLLAEERDVAGMADAIGRILSDQARWDAFSARAPQMVAERFDIRRQTVLLEDYYDEVRRTHAQGSARA